MNLIHRPSLDEVIGVDPTARAMHSRLRRGRRADVDFGRRVPGGVRGFLPPDLQECLWCLHAGYDVARDGSNKTGAWGDLGPKSHDAVQAGGTKQPTWSETSLNGRWGITFDGAQNQCLRIPTVDYETDDATVTLALVAKDTSTVLSVICEGLAGGGQLFSVLANPGAGQVRFYLEGTTTANSGFIAETLATPRRMIVTFDYTLAGAPGVLEVDAWIDGVPVTLTQDNSQNTTGFFSDGAMNFGARNDGSALGWSGTLGLSAAWGRRLSTAEKTYLDTWMKSEWLL